MSAVLNAVLPVFFVVITGWAVRKYVLPQKEFWQALDGLIFNLLLPALLLKLFSSMQVSQFQSGLPMLSLIVVVFLGMALLAKPVHYLGLDGPRYTSYFQTTTRTNFFISLSIAKAIYGQEGLDMLALCLLALVPVDMMTSTYILARHGTSTQKPGLFQTAKKMVVNPLMIAAILGLCINGLTQGHPPKSLTTTLEIFARASLPLALLSVGAGICMRCIRKPSYMELGATFTKLIIHPALMVGAGVYFGLEPPTIGILVLVSGVPAAAASYTMARKMGGHTHSVATILTLQILGAILTLPIWLLLVQ